MALLHLRGVILEVPLDQRVLALQNLKPLVVFTKLSVLVQFQRFLVFRLLRKLVDTKFELVDAPRQLDNGLISLADLPEVFAVLNLDWLDLLDHKVAHAILECKIFHRSRLFDNFFQMCICKQQLLLLFENVGSAL